MCGPIYGNQGAHLLCTAWSLDPVPVPGSRVAFCSRALLKAAKQQAAELALLMRHAAYVHLTWQYYLGGHQAELVMTRIHAEAAALPRSCAL